MAEEQVATKLSGMIRGKMEATLGILNSAAFKEAMHELDISETARAQARKDLVGYLKGKGVEFPEGVGVEVVVTEESPKRVRAGVQIVVVLEVE